MLRFSLSFDSIARYFPFILIELPKLIHCYFRLRLRNTKQCMYGQLLLHVIVIPAKVSVTLILAQYDFYDFLNVFFTIYYCNLDFV